MGAKEGDRLENGGGSIRRVCVLKAACMLSHTVVIKITTAISPILLIGEQIELREFQ